MTEQKYIASIGEEVPGPQPSKYHKLADAVVALETIKTHLDEFQRKLINDENVCVAAEPLKQRPLVDACPLVTFLETAPVFIRDNIDECHQKIYDIEKLLLE